MFQYFHDDIKFSDRKKFIALGWIRLKKKIALAIETRRCDEKNRLVFKINLIVILPNRVILIRGLFKENSCVSRPIRLKRLYKLRIFFKSNSADAR